LKKNIQVSFDFKGGFTNYENAGMLAHYHEAAYDAYMTGYAFVNIIKFKEFEQPKEETKNNNKKGQY
jgi:hypothetical protein